MASTITATIDGQTFTVDLSMVTGLDAITYRGEVGADLDALVASWVEAGAVVTLADLAIIKWLWTRQRVDPLASLARVAQTVTLVPADDLDPHVTAAGG